MKVTPKIYTCHMKPPYHIAELNNQDNRNKCLRNAPKLEGTNIFINEHTSKATARTDRNMLNSYYRIFFWCTHSYKIPKSTTFHSGKTKSSRFPTSTNKDDAGGSNNSGSREEIRKPCMGQRSTTATGNKEVLQ